MTLTTTLTILSMLGYYFIGSACATSTILILIKYEIIDWLDTYLPRSWTPICIFCLGFWLGLGYIVLINYLIGGEFNWILIVPAFASATKTVDVLTGQQ